MNKENPIRIAIVDSYRICRESLCNLLEDNTRIDVIAHDDQWEPLAERLKPGDIDILVVEPKGLGMNTHIFMSKTLASFKDIKIFMLSTQSGNHSVLRLMRAGLLGWAGKSISLSDFEEALARVHSGSMYLPPEMERMFAEEYLRPDREPGAEDSLSEREYQVLQSLALGSANREIAADLGIGIKTVDTHRQNLLRKLSLRNNADLTRFAVKNGLISV